MNETTNPYADVWPHGQAQATVLEVRVSLLDGITTRWARTTGTTPTMEGVRQILNNAVLDVVTVVNGDTTVEFRRAA